MRSTSRASSIGWPAGLVVVGRSREPHQPASFGDRETTGPAMTDVVSLLGGRTSREAPFRNSFSSTSLPTSRSSAAMRASWVCTMSAATTSSVEGAGLVLGHPDAHQVAIDLMALGEPVQGLAGQVLLRHLALELDRIAAVLAHGLSPRKPGPDSPILTSSPVHPQGCTPQNLPNLLQEQCKLRWR